MNSPRYHRTRALPALLLLVGAPTAAFALGAAPAAALTTISVTSTADTGSGSLRDALTAANAASGDSEIDIAAGLSITLASSLPAYDGGTTGTGNLTVKGNGATVAGASGSVFRTGAGYNGALSFDTLTLTGGGDAVSLGGSASVTLTNTTIGAGSGDGIDADQGAVSLTNSTITNRGSDGIDAGSGGVTVTGSTLSDNHFDGVDTSSAAITVTGSSIAGNGENGIDTGHASTVSVSGSTIANNTEDGIDTSLNATVTLKDSTIAGNKVDGIDTGQSQVNLAYDTFTGNGAGSDNHVAQLFAYDAVSLTAFGTVFANPAGSATNCSASVTTTSQGYDYADDTTCAFAAGTDKQGAADPKLGALAANGGVGQTQVPQSGSPLIDAVSTASCQSGLGAGVTADERGVTRPQGSGCDIGAVEVAVAVPTPPPATTPAPAATAPVAGATTVHTGEGFAGSRPFVLSALALGFGLVVAGVGRRRATR